MYEPGSVRLPAAVNALMMAGLAGDGEGMAVIVGDLNVSDTAVIIAHLAGIAAGMLAAQHGHAGALALLQREALDLAQAG